MSAHQQERFETRPRTAIAPKAIAPKAEQNNRRRLSRGNRERVIEHGLQHDGYVSSCNSSAHSTSRAEDQFGVPTIGLPNFEAALGELSGATRHRIQLVVRADPPTAGSDVAS